METAALKKQVNQLWKQAVDQLEEVKVVLTDRFEGDLVRLREERDKLLRQLGEQTYKLANQGTLPVPAIIKRTVDRLNEVIDSIVSAQKQARKPAKKVTKKAPARKKKSRPRATT